MNTFVTIFGVLVFLSPIFFIGYRVGFRRGLRAASYGQRQSAYNEKRIIAEGLDWLVNIAYTDARKKRSERRVTVHRVYGRTPKTPTHIEGYCHTRRQARTFIVANIQQLIDLSTGVVADNAQAAIAARLNTSLEK
jgi:hypothetical protein